MVTPDLLRQGYEPKRSSPAVVIFAPASAVVRPKAAAFATGAKGIWVVLFLIYILTMLV
jgi:hypothetical protein